MHKFKKHQLVVVEEEAKVLYSIPIDGLLEIVHVEYDRDECIEMLVQRKNEDGSLRSPHGIFSVLPKSVQPSKSLG